MKKNPIFTEWRVDTPVDQIIGEAIGAASLCWEYPERAGVFDVKTAGEIALELTEILKAKLWIDE